MGSNTYNLVGYLRKASSTQTINEEWLVRRCAFNHTLHIVGKRWRPILLWNIGNGVNRFGELRREVADISEKVLVYELRNMLALQLIEKKVTRIMPVKETRYCLTIRGLSLMPLLEFMQKWGKEDQNLQEEGKL